MHGFYRFIAIQTFSINEMGYEGIKVQEMAGFCSTLYDTFENARIPGHTNMV